LFIINFSFITATNYYVNATTGSDSNSGLTPALAWQTIAKVNAASFLPGDNIYFERGGVWRPSENWGDATYGLQMDSGNSSNYVTYTAYGTGHMPLITAADSILGWTNLTEATIFSDNFDDNDISDWDTVESGITVEGGQLKINATTGANYRVYTALGGSYSELNVTWKFIMKSGYTGWASGEFARGSGLRSTGLKYAMLGVEDDSGTKRWHYYYNNDSASAEGIVTGTTVSDDTEYTLGIYFKAATAPGANDGIYQFFVDNSLIYSITNADSDTVVFNQALVGMGWVSTMNAIFYEDDYAIYAPVSNLWSNSSLTLDPNVVWLDNESYLEATSAVNVNATNRWYWDSSTNITYLYATNTPSSFYSSIDIPVKGFAASSYNKDYWKVDGLDFKYGTSAPFAIQGDSDNNVVNNSVIEGAGVYNTFQIQGTSNYNLVNNCTISGLNRATGTDTFWIGCDGSDCPSWNNITHNNISRGVHSTLKLQNVANNTVEYNEIWSAPGYGRGAEIEGELGIGGNIFRYNYEI